MRPSFHDVYMDLAQNISRRSNCRRLHVGCVVTSHDFRKVLALGYNGNASGLTNDCDSDEPGKCGCLHAEENAIINCDVARATPKVVFCTTLPCVMCAKRLINLGSVGDVIFETPYRITTSIELFKATSIRTYRYVREWGTDPATCDKPNSNGATSGLIPAYDVKDLVALGLPPLKVPVVQ